MRNVFYFILLSLCLLVSGAISEAETHDVQLYDFYYLPKDLTSATGDKVRFVWVDAFHDAVAGAVPGLPGTAYQEAFRTLIDDQIPFIQEVTFTRDLIVTYPAPNNRYEYYCTPHFTQGMIGSVTVLRSEQAFVADAVGWQAIPGNESQKSANCSATLNSDETELEISCSHNLTGITAAHIHSGILGNSGAVVCAISTISNSTTNCAIPSQTDANSLWNGGYYVNFHTDEFPDGEIRGQLLRVSEDRTVSGTVRNVTGFGLQGVTVSDGQRNATTDSQGKFTIENVPSGVYQISAAKAGFTIAANDGVSPYIVNASNRDKRDFTASDLSNSGCVSDSDGDGVCNDVESADGSNSNDAGSFKDHLISPVRVLWNGFLDIVNIVAITNSGSNSAPVHIKLHDSSGAVVHQLDIIVSGQGETDIIVNDLPGFSINSVGILSIEFDSEYIGVLDGQIFYYKRNFDFTGYEFAFGVPFVAPTFGTSAVAFNTFQPSRNAAQADNQVAQWLSVVNLDESDAKSFTLNKYSQSGELLSTKSIDVPPFGRLDFEGGHVEPGANTVGLNVIIPSDPSAPYLSQLYRYGGDSPAGVAALSYSFAFPLLSRAGNGEVQSVPISLGGGAENWLEVVNVLQQAVDVTLQFYSSTGELLGTEQFNLGPYAQAHFNAGLYLPAGSIGSAIITPNRSNSIIGQSMFYFRDAATGTVTAMYGTSFREVYGSKSVGSYNLFLNMFNWLTLVNSNEGAAIATVTVFDTLGAPKVSQLELAGHSSIQLPLHDAQFGTTADTFGVVEVESNRAGVVLSEVLRVRQRPDGNIDFAVPVAVR